MSLKQNESAILEITDLGSHGEGVGRYEGMTVFVEGALPGERVQVQILECHKRYLKAHLLKIVEPSADRVTPSCPLFGKCGGCQLMHLDYSSQLISKQKRVLNALVRIGNLTEVRVEPCISSPSSLQYRNKIQLPVKNGEKGLEIGLYANASHHLVEIDSCQIHCPMGDRIYNEVKKVIKNSDLMAYDPMTGAGSLRHILIKSAVFSQKALVILVMAHSSCQKKLKDIAKQIMALCPEVKGVIQNRNNAAGNAILGKEYIVLEGESSIYEKLGNLTFKVSPASFFQVNPQQAIQLYSKALEFTHLNGSERVLDAYCGVGTLSLFFAKHAKKVIGVECVPEAILDAKKNAELNDINNVEFICQKAEHFISKLDYVDVVLLNPPRKGCELKVLKEIQRLSPSQVIYISCDPGTLARDLAHLNGFGYRISAVQPFDMFPQTSHVECVVHLEPV